MNKTLGIIAKEGEKISFILQPTKTLAYWPSSDPAQLKPLTKAFTVNFCSPSAGKTILVVPLGSREFVRDSCARR